MLFLFSFILCTAELYSQGFTVSDYSVEIFINKEGYFDVKEKYQLNFEVPKHGIYRDIQVSYDLRTEDGSLEQRDIKLSNIEVPGYKYEVSSGFEQRLNGSARIKIGDADITLEGPHIYEINYRVKNAFLYEEANTQFYWNIKPSNWVPDFQSIDFKIHLPEGVTLSPEQAFVYSGALGNTQPSNDFQTNLSGGIFSGISNEGYSSAGGESVTVLLKLPPYSIQVIKPFWPFWTESGWLLILTLVFYAFIRIWLKHGKDDPVTTTTSYYPPKGMDPAMVGYLIDDSSDNSDLISLIPYWASKGFLKIEDIDKKGWFAKDDTKLIKLAP
ncbi:DUF2207 domain-containing protein [Algoriphagus halophilus]|uniref:DUF2207 domain-containing protein n=1 Tax=Algoriphagus halophilus TaxID=226505 RepID=UPI00358F37E3